MKKGKKKSSAAGKRLSFPGDEAAHPWLSLLLEAYHVVDRGVAASVRAEEKKGRILACARGCSACCRAHKDIPVYPLELMGIAWFATERISGQERERLKEQLVLFKENKPCPFLLDNACSIHPLRPMACRQFNVFGQPCQEGEDAFLTRRQDVMAPVKKHVDQAFFIMLPFHGIEKESERVSVIESGSFHRMVRELHVCNWQELASMLGNRNKAWPSRKEG